LTRVLRKLPGCCRAAIRKTCNAVGQGLQAHDKPAGESNGTRAPASGPGKAGQPEGKGAALHWWLEQTRSAGDDQEPILILDADSRPAPDLLDRLRRLVQEGEQVIQVREAPMIASSSPAAVLAALSEVVEHRVKDVIRSWLGWPGLRGTGMLIRRGLLQELSPRLSTLVEDNELTLMLAEKRIPIHYLDQTCVADHKPESAPGAAGQRARWMRGQVRALWVHRRAVWRILLQGMPGWSLLASIFLKPVTLFSMLKGAVCLVFVSAFLLKVSALAGAAGAAVMLSLVFEAGLYLAGLRYLPDRSLILRAAAGLLLYGLLWIRSAVLSVWGGDRWHRARPEPEIDDGEWL
jgi:cellulose synthase/poly-beta-1,6-N-acetylglucosamine synthase-like glycosyltransferase